MMVLGVALLRYELSCDCSGCTATAQVEVDPGGRPSSKVRAERLGRTLGWAFRDVAAKDKVAICPRHSFIATPGLPAKTLRKLLEMDWSRDQIGDPHG